MVAPQLENLILQSRAMVKESRYIHSFFSDEKKFHHTNLQSWNDDSLERQYQNCARNHTEVLDNSNFTVIYDTARHTVPHWQKLTASLPEYPISIIENDDKFDDSYDYFSYK